MTLSVSGLNNAITHPTFPTDADGQTTAMVASTRAEVKTVTANVGFFPLIKTAAIKFVAVLPDIVAAAVTPNSLPADGTSTATIAVAIIVIVGSHFGESGITAASAVRMVEEQNVILTHKSLFRRLQRELGCIPNPTSEVTTVQRLVNQLLRYAEPAVDETKLLQNYPNPFNPETWIPYQLAEPGAVSITICNLHGEIVRQLKLGQRETGTYFSGQRAAYWDGRNEHGDRVASGVYFYHLRVDGAVDIEATKRLVILK